MAAPGAPGPGLVPVPVPAPPTVLMAARAELAAPSRLLPAAPAGAALRLQLSVEPEPGGRRRFRLGLRVPEAPEGAPQAQFDLRSISYHVRGPASHELELLEPGMGTQGTGTGTQGTDRGTGTDTGPGTVTLRFPEEREAQQWWTVLSSSLREARRAPEGTGTASEGTGTAPGDTGTAPGDTGTAPGGTRTAPGDTVTAPGDTEPEQDLEEAQTLELAQREELALRLAAAIAAGDTVVAAQSAVALARQHTELSVSLRESSYPGGEISMAVGVEDATSSANITLWVRPHVTIGTLKEQVFQQFGFHPRVQRWIIGQCLCSDGRSVGSYGIRRDGDTAFLYLLAAPVAGLSRDPGTAPGAAPGTAPGTEHGTAQALLRALPGARESPPTAGPSSPRRGRVPAPGDRMDIGAIRQHLDSLQLQDGAPPVPSPEQGWPCPTCTFINKPTRPGCEMCSCARPAGYRVPGGHCPDPAERQRLQRERDAARQCQQPRSEETSRGSLEDFVHLCSDFG